MERIVLGMMFGHSLYPLFVSRALELTYFPLRRETSCEESGLSETSNAECLQADV